jgi:hypothetical protein
MSEKIQQALRDPFFPPGFRSGAYSEPTPKKLSDLREKMRSQVVGNVFPEGVRAYSNVVGRVERNGKLAENPWWFGIAVGEHGNLQHVYAPFFHEYRSLLIRKTAKKLKVLQADVERVAEEPLVSDAIAARFNTWGRDVVHSGLQGNKYYPEFHFSQLLPHEVVRIEGEPKAGIILSEAMEKRRAWEMPSEAYVNAVASHFLRTTTRAALRGGPIMDILGFNGKPFIYDSEK